MHNLNFTEKKSKLNHATIIIDVDTDKYEKLQEALTEVISGVNGNACILRSLKTGECSSPIMTFFSVISKVGNLYDDLEPNGPRKKIKLHVNYSNESDRFTVDTKLGEVHVKTIIFYGELYVTESLVPLTVTAEYRRIDNAVPISQAAAFEPVEIQGSEFLFEMHKLEDTGETHVVLRKVSGKAQEAAADAKEQRV